jgi:hypothetical protein
MSKHEHIKQFETETDTVKALRRAREMIEAGWCQKIASIVKDDRHDRCAATAINDACAEIGRPLMMSPRKYFYRSIGCLNNDVPRWNDDEYRTKEDVLAAFDRAIRLAMAS